MNSAQVSFLQIEPTTRCNLCCGFCAGRHEEQRDMPMDIFREIFHLFPGIQHIELQGEGEPLLSGNFFSMLEYLQEKNPQASVSTITNGLLLTPEVSMRILHLNLKKILVSLESARKEEYRQIRGGDLKRLVDNILSFLEIRQSMGKLFPVIGFSVVVLKSTLNALPEIAWLYQKIGMDGGIAFQVLQNMPQYTSHYSTQMLNQKISKEQARTFGEHIRSSKRVQTVLRRHSESGGFYNVLYTGKGTEWKFCPWLEKRGLFICANGLVTTCCFIKDSSNFSLGKLGYDDTQDILSKADSLLDQLRIGKIPRNCNGCSLVKEIL
jgi:MoaA/NifB/PqqE/SkfB family radical SAM enzyme